MAGWFRWETARRAAAFSALAIICVSPLFFGCSPPWACGFLLAALCCLSGLHVAISGLSGREWFPAPFPLRASVALMIGWLGLTVVFDWIEGPACGRVPAISLRELPFAIAYAGAAILGMAYCRSADDMMNVIKAVALVGLAMGAMALAEVLAIDVKSAGGMEAVRERPSGLYTNPNRFAVLMAVCWMCAFGGLLDELTDRTYLRTPDYRLVALFLGSILVTGSCVGLSLSRLTVTAIGATSAGIGLAVAGSKISLLHGDWRGVDLSPIEKVRRLCLGLLPITVMAGWAAWTFTAGTSFLRGRFAAIMAEDVTFGGRLRAIEAGLPLIAERPVFGHGLGMFESVFTRVQPPDMLGRWRELHSDWLQLAVEAGIPALALAVILAVAWAGSWIGDILRAGRKGWERPWVVIFPAAGVLVAMICSALDFPLREPATAALVFFTAGGVVTARRWAKGTARAIGGAGGSSPSGGRDLTVAEIDSPHGGGWSSNIRRLLRAAAAAAMAAFFVWGAFVSGRSGLAYAASPWMGQVFCPKISADQLDGWKAAAAWDPGDPELRFRTAACVVAGPSNPTSMAYAAERIAEASAMQPFDYRFPALEGAISERGGDVERAAAAWERAAMLAPRNVWVRVEVGALYLRRAGSQTMLDPAAWERELESALRHWRVAVEAEPGLAFGMIAALKASGCTNSEVARLWPGEGVKARIARAKFYIGQGDLAAADAEIEEGIYPDADGGLWYYALRGGLALAREDAVSCSAEWSAALDALWKTGGSGEAEAWMARFASAAGADICADIAGRLADRLPACPALAEVLARKLLAGGRLVMANKVLEKSHQRSPRLQALWAEMALQLGDFEEARSRAETLRNGNLASLSWARWYDEFVARLERSRRKKGAG